MSLIGKLYQLNIAILPIGGRTIMGVLEAAHAVNLVNAKHVIPFHYETLPGFAQTADEFIEKTKAQTEKQIHLPKAGNAIFSRDLG